MYRTTYRTVRVEGLSVFYREAGPADAPAILLLRLAALAPRAPAAPAGHLGPLRSVVPGR
jgi:hypothetical protein